MKRFAALLMVCLLSFTSVAFADIYTLDEILPSIATYTDEELQMLDEKIDEELQARGVQAETEEEPQATEAVADDTPYTEREDYVERESVQRGDKGDNALAVQERLIELGYLTGTADGNFGKKSENAVIAFQKANGLEETGIADSITQYVMFSDEAIDKEAFDNMPIRTGDGWEMLKEYYYSDSIDEYYYAFVLKNTSGYDATIDCNVVFYDENDNMVGVSNITKNGCENGYETCWLTMNDVEFDHATVDVSITEETLCKAAQSSIELTTNVAGDKVIITAKNTGDEAVDYVEYDAIFLDENGDIVFGYFGYLVDSDGQIKPGAQEMSEAPCYEEFSDAIVYAFGCIY